MQGSSYYYFDITTICILVITNCVVIDQLSSVEGWPFCMNDHEWCVWYVWVSSWLSVKTILGRWILIKWVLSGSVWQCKEMLTIVVSNPELKWQRPLRLNSNRQCYDSIETLIIHIYTGCVIYHKGINNARLYWLECPYCSYIQLVYKRLPVGATGIAFLTKYLGWTLLVTT